MADLVITDAPKDFFRNGFSEIFRILKKNSHFYLFCEPALMFVAKPLGETAGFKFWKPLIWDKEIGDASDRYGGRYGNVLFFEKGKRKLKDLSVSDILKARDVADGGPADKPPAVTDVLIRQSSEEGELVLDPFMGAGSIGMSAVSGGRHFLGNDLSSAAIGLARNRLIAAGGTEGGIQRELRWSIAM